MIDCPFYTDAGTCQHIDAGVGLPILVDVRACGHCVATYPKEARKEGKVVKHWIYGQRRKNGLPAERPQRITMESVRREHKTRKNIADEMLAIARTVPKRAPAPIVATGEERLEICTDCIQWSVTNQRCRAACNCANRPRPLDDKGKDCPLKKWRRPTSPAP